MKKIYITVLILSFSTGIFAQLSHSIEGIVLDKSNEPLSYASIGIKGTSIGTSTNKEGRFILSIQPQHMADTLYISHIGYKTLYFFYKDSRENSVYLLDTHSEFLDEITVKAVGLTPIEVLKEAIDSTLKRSLYPSILHTYVREFTKKNNQFNYFADAFVDYYLPIKLDKKYIDVSVPESRVRKVKVKLDEGFDYNFSSPIDIRSLPDYRNPKKLLKYINEEYCDFKLVELNSGKTEKTIKIEFTPKSNQKKQFQEGIIIIDKETMIILSFECHISEAYKDFTPSARLFSLQSQLDTRNIYVRNEMISGHCYLRNVRFDGIVVITNRKNIKVNYHFISEMITRKVSIDSIELFERGKRFKYNQLYYLAGKNNGDNFTTQFWKNQNGLLATKEEEDIIESLSRNNEYSKKN